MVLNMMILVEYEKCSGCRSCEATCSYFKEKQINPSLSRIRVSSWLRDSLRVPSVCQQCEEPPCEAVCPTKAIRRDTTMDVVTVNGLKCIGCKACLIACPFGAMGWNSERKVPIKCDKCNGDPRCVKVCVPKAIQYVPASTVNLHKMRVIATKMKDVTSSTGENAAKMKAGSHELEVH